MLNYNNVKIYNINFLLGGASDIFNLRHTLLFTISGTLISCL